MTLLAAPATGKLLSTYLDNKTPDSIRPREQMAKSSINLRPKEHDVRNENGDNSNDNIPETPRSQSMATLQPSQEAKKEEASSTSNPSSPATKSKFQGLGASLRSKLQLIGSPLKSKSPSETPEKTVSDARRRRRLSVTSTSSSETPQIQINDSSINLNLDEKIYLPHRLSHSARPGRMTSASSLKKRKKKKRRSKSEAVLQEKKKDKWADYAMQYAGDIEMEGGIKPRDKWDKYVKNCIQASDSPLLRKAEKKIVQMTYSSDDSDGESDKVKKKGAKFKKTTNDKNPKPSQKGDSSGSDTDKGDEEEESEDENDLHARLLASMEKEVIPEETEEDLMTQRKAEVTPQKPIPPPTTKPSTASKVKEASKQNDNSKTTNNNKSTAPKKQVIASTNNNDKTAAKVPEKGNVKPNPKPQQSKKDPVEKDPEKLKPPAEHLKVETKNKNYKNGPVVDFQEQIRKISSINQPDMSQLVIPEKHITMNKNVGKPSTNLHDEDIHHAINDILKDEEKAARPKTGKRSSITRPINNAEPKKAELLDDLKKLRELEDDILQNHKEDTRVTNSKKQDKTKAKGTEVDNLISELKLTV